MRSYQPSSTSVLDTRQHLLLLHPSQERVFLLVRTNAMSGTFAVADIAPGICDETVAATASWHPCADDPDCARTPSQCCEPTSLIPASDRTDASFGASLIATPRPLDIVVADSTTPVNPVLEQADYILKTEVDDSNDASTAELDNGNDGPNSDRDGSNTLEDLDDILHPDLADPNGTPLPLMPTRAGMNANKIQALFSKYGLAHQPLRRSIGKPPQKCRRVEKPIRMKMHWRCHECGTLPGREKTCGGCGHDRCNLCSRVPAKAVTELIDWTRRLKEQDEEQRKKDTLLVDRTPYRMDAAKLDAAEEKILPALPERLDETDCTTTAIMCEATTLAQGPSLTLTTRSRAVEAYTFRSNAQMSGRCCDQCATPYTPDSRTDCVKCGHERPLNLPHQPAKLQRWPSGSPSDERPHSPFKADVIQRVYKKPRVRVRYTCDHCDTVFVDRNTCVDCGHGRCKDCVRYP